jgi:hypothetical protein
MRIIGLSLLLSLGCGGLVSEDLTGPAPTGPLPITTNPTPSTTSTSPAPDPAVSVLPLSECPNFASPGEVMAVCAVASNGAVYNLEGSSGLRIVPISGDLRIYVRFAPGKKPQFSAVHSWAVAAPVSGPSAKLPEDNPANKVQQRLVTETANEFIYSLGNLGPSALQVASLISFNPAKSCPGAASCGYQMRFYLNGTPR